MKTKFQFAAAVSAFFLLHSAFGQGALTPPGAPAATMKSLAQIEPRTPISSAPYFILTPGSYYLTGNLTVSSGGAIAIVTNNVTLDLNGFTISSTASPAGGTAILLTGTGPRMNVSIYNGHISSNVTNTIAGVFGGTGFNDGINYLIATPPYNVRVKDVSVSGVFDDGINLNTGNSTVVQSCTVNVAAYDGIVADSVSDSTALSCGTEGIYAVTVQNCQGQAFSGPLSVGITATTAINCVGYNNSTGTGLASTVATGCTGTSSSGIGLSAFIANVCHGVGSPALSVTHNVNSF